MSPTTTNIFQTLAVSPPWRAETAVVLDVARPTAKRGKIASGVGSALARIAATASRGTRDAIPQHQTIYESLGITPMGR